MLSFSISSVAPGISKHISYRNVFQASMNTFAGRAAFATLCIPKNRHVGPQRCPVPRQRRAEKDGAPDIQCRGQMGDSGVVSDKEITGRQDGAEKLQRHHVKHDGPTGGKRRENLFGKPRLCGALNNQKLSFCRRYEMPREFHELQNRPSFCFRARPRMQRRQAVLSIPAMLF